MKVALCFIINYDHILNKENIWRSWIDVNQDILNVYFYYKDITQIKSTWILKHIIHPSYIYETSYYKVIPAYLSVMNYAVKHDHENQWFCMLTESCCPIISPKKFRHLFYKHRDSTIMSWRKAWWNVTLQKRANLSMIPQELHLANDPWFVMKREDVLHCFHFTHIQTKIFQLICDGGLANESLFSIILSLFHTLEYVKNNVTHLTDWSRMTSSTSPYVFREATPQNIRWIENSLREHPYAMFIRKISPEFSDEVINDFIYTRNKEEDLRYFSRDPFYQEQFLMKIKKYFLYFCIFLVIFKILLITYIIIYKTPIPYF